MTVEIRRDGRAVYSKSYGYADMELGVAATPENRYAIGSITKSLTSYVVLSLVHDGKLSLSARLADVLPDYRGPGGDATILNLLTHTGGVPDLAGDSAPSLITDPSKTYTRADVVALFSDKPAVFAPGSKWQYSNSGYYLLGLVIEKVTGQSFDAVVQARILDPWRLKHTAFDHHAAIMPGRVRGYTVDEAGKLANAASYDGVLALSGGGYRMSAPDLATWIETLFDPSRTPPDVRAMMFHPVSTPDGEPVFYLPSALMQGDLDHHRRYSHPGGIWGGAAYVAYFPDDRTTLAVMLNTDNPHIALDALVDRLSRLALGLPEATSATVPFGEAEAASFVGVYDLDELVPGGDRLDIAWHEGRLELAFMTLDGRRSHVTPLEYEGGGRFRSVRNKLNHLSFPASVAGPAKRLAYVNGDYTLRASRR